MGKRWHHRTRLGKQLFQLFVGAERRRKTIFAGTADGDGAILMRHDVKTIQEDDRHGRVNRRVKKRCLPLHRLPERNAGLQAERIADQGERAVPVGDNGMAEDNLFPEDSIARPACGSSETTRRCSATRT